MKKSLMIFCIAATVMSCNNAATTDVKPAAKDSMAETPATTAKFDYPYALKRPYQNWQSGNQQHAVTVMKSLKDWESGNIESCTAAFGDSIELYFDRFEAKVSNDSLKKIFAQSRGEYSSVTVKMDDWESVISSDKKEEWVTLWYKQIWTDKKGKTDSMEVGNDAKIVNGKVVLLDEKTRHYPAKK